MRSPSCRAVIGCLVFMLLLANFSADTQETDLANLAERVSKDLSRKHAKTAVVFVFSGPEGRSTELGRQLADEFAETLRARPNPITIIERGSLDPLVERHKLAKYASQKGVACWLSKQGGAKALIGGFLELREASLLLTVRAFETANCRELTKQTGTIIMSAERKALLAVQLPPPAASEAEDTSVESPPSGVPQAGKEKTTFPMCDHCPSPTYAGDARDAHLECRVVLRAVITTDGRATQILVLEPCPLGLTEKAVEAVERWKFKPAKGPDGSPVEAWTPIEINFRIW